MIREKSEGPLTGLARKPRHAAGSSAVCNVPLRPFVAPPIFVRWVVGDRLSLFVPVSGGSSRYEVGSNMGMAMGSGEILGPGVLELELEYWR